MMRYIAPDVTWYQNFIFAVLLKLPGVQDIRSTVTLLEAKSVRGFRSRFERSAEPSASRESAHLLDRIAR